MTLDLIQTKFPLIATLGVAMGNNSMFHEFAYLLAVHPAGRTEGLALVDARLKTISSLRKIVQTAKRDSRVLWLVR